MGKIANPGTFHKRSFFFCFLPGLLLLMPALCLADDAVCASVKIEIRQELALERQGFDAHMRINNGLSHITLEDVLVSVSFADEDGNPVLASSDPDNTEALFFIRLDSMENIADIDGAGTVGPSTSADIHWLIVPAPGAAKGLPQGTLYYVGATLTYTIGGETHTTEVRPDYIFVKPLPSLVLDYFLPSEVYGDDAFTPEIEPPVPFNLGVRVKNNGQGVVKSLKIDSAQPRIVDNEQGLLVGFVIESAQVNDQPVTPSLLVDLGDIDPGGSGAARWIMTCSLSGEFTGFNAQFTHSDELGGKLTSLIEAVHTHLMVRDVLVDLPGRDSVRDFLAKNDSVYRVYESEAVDADVSDQSAWAALAYEGQSGTETTYRLSVPETAGYMYAQLADPFAGQMALKTVIRSDGKIIRSENAWLSKTRDQDQNWHYFINLFDPNTTGTYTVVFDDPGNAPQPPVLQHIPDRSSVEGEQLSFIVEATDPNSTIPAISASPLPVGAVSTDQGDGTGIFDWTPAVGQAGRYQVTFSTSDGILEDSQQVMLTIFSIEDTDGDGMTDTWEMDHFGTLDRDGSGDFDGDGISDLDEFLNGTDPGEMDQGPTAPQIVAPVDGAAVDSLQPVLTIAHSTDANSDDLTYTFELYANADHRQQVAAETEIIPGPNFTDWTVPVELGENTRYYWRARSFDGVFQSPWTTGGFIINTLNDPPGELALSHPEDSTYVDTASPVLEVVNAVDPEGDLIFYTFSIFSDAGMTEVIAVSPEIVQGDTGVTTWVPDIPLADGETYTWQVTATDIHGHMRTSTPAGFSVNLQNLAPTPPQIASPAPDSYWQTSSIDLSVVNATDADGDVLTYWFELDTTPLFNSSMRQVSGDINEGASNTTWTVTDLDDDTVYYWRVRANDGICFSRWARGSFCVNTQNQAPQTPVIENPGPDSVTGTTTPILRAYPGADPEQDHGVYRYEIYDHPDLTAPLAVGEVSTPFWQVFPAVDDHTRYWWRVRLSDAQGQNSSWSPAVGFWVDADGMNDPPRLVFEEPLVSIRPMEDAVNISWKDWDGDDDALIALYYDTDRSGADGELIVSGISEGADASGDTYAWDISSLSEGTYYIYAVINDSDYTATIYAPGALTIPPDTTPPTVQVNPPGETYPISQSVTITADEPADIHYTLDGSEPTTDSTLYVEPIVISQDTVLKCLAVDPAGNTSEIIAESYVIGAADLRVQVGTDKGRALAGLRVYAFTESGSYTGIYRTTDDEGAAVFNPTDFSDGNYKFRVDYLGNHFWSAVVPVPGTWQLDVLIDEEIAEITVSSTGQVAAGVRVYLFSAGGTYLGIYRVTDENGQVRFDLPVGMAFSFRADILGGQYWSHSHVIAEGGLNEIDLDAGGGGFQVRIQENEQTPMTAVQAYLFSAAGSYLGEYRNSNEDGIVSFDVPAGDYAVRADYLGYQFWSEDTPVATDTMVTLSIPHQDVTVTIESVFNDENQPLSGVKAYLFSGAGSYLGQYQTSGEDGKAVFHLPQKPYKVRADYLGGQYWSEVFTLTDPTIQLAMADAEITVTSGGFPLFGVEVYVFSAAGSYLSLHQTTDADGLVSFRLPEGTYKFRADHLGNQYWSSESLLTPYIANPIGISTGGGNFALSVITQTGEPLADVKCYVFSQDDVYQGMFGTTDNSGQVFFDLTDGFYKFRTDHLGNQFWSDVAGVPDDLSSIVTIGHEAVQVSVTSSSQPAADINVYLFSDTETYLGQFNQTDTDGRVSYALPIDRIFRFRADILGNQYWSDPVQVAAGGPNDVLIDAGGGSWQVTFQEQSGVPMAGVKVYLFHENGSYIDIYQTTDTDGLATFEVPQGSYRIRADYLGYQFWSPDTLIDENTGSVLDIEHQQTQINVTGTFQSTAEPLAGLKVYLFTSTDTYLDQFKTTDSDGKVVFNLPQKDYKVRVDYLGGQYWSGTISWEDTTVDIPMAEAVITVTGGGFPQAGQPVYAYSAAGTYLGLSEITDAGGEVSFRLPTGTYKFRTDHQGNQYWSATEVLEPGDGNTIIISTGGGLFTFSVAAAPNEALTGAKCYVFSHTGSYLGMSGATDLEGRVFFDLADGDFKFRVDHLGYQFWSDVYTVPAVLTGDLNLGQQDVVVTVQGMYQSAEPLEGLKASLFSPVGSYLGQYLFTDAAGRVTFNLPDEPYKVRVDYLGNQFWSNDFQQQDTTLTIHQGKAVIHVHRSGSNVEGAKIYLFSDSDSYLGRNQTSDTAGEAEFILPDRTFRFRVDEGGDQVWSQAIHIQAGVDSAVEIDLD